MSNVIEMKPTPVADKFMSAIEAHEDEMLAKMIQTGWQILSQPISFGTKIVLDGYIHAGMSLEMAGFIEEAQEIKLLLEIALANIEVSKPTASIHHFPSPDTVQ